MEIRTYESRDLEVCRSLWAEMVGRHREIYEDPTIGGENPGLEFDGHLDQIGESLIWVAEMEDEVVGFVSLILEGEEAEIEPIVVRAGSRGTGIGFELVDHAVAQAKHRGVLCLSVKPVARNEEAISFFHDAGFRTLGHVQLFRWLGESHEGQWKEGPELFGLPFDF